MTATLGADVIRASDGSGPVSFPDGILTETVNGVAPGALDTVTARNAAIALAVANPLGGYTRVVVVDAGGNGDYETQALAAAGITDDDASHLYNVFVFGVEIDWSLWNTRPYIKVYGQSNSFLFRERYATDGLPSQNQAGVNGSGWLRIVNAAGTRFLDLSFYEYGQLLRWAGGTQLEVWGTNQYGDNVPVMTFVAAYPKSEISIRKPDDTNSILIGYALTGDPYIKTEAVNTNLSIAPTGDLTLSPGSGRTAISGISEYADNAAAVAGGLTAGMLYRTGDLLKVVHA